MKQWIQILFIMLVVVLSGCRSQEQKALFSDLNHQITNQNACNINNETLTNLISTETAIYNEIIEKGFDSFEDISPLLEEGKKNVEESSKYLNDYQTCILQNQINEQMVTEEINLIKDPTIKQATEELVTKYVQYEASLNEYVESRLTLNEAEALFYNEVNETTTISKLDELMTKMNTAIENAQMNYLTHQESLADFNSSYTSYYEKYMRS